MSQARRAWKRLELSGATFKELNQNLQRKSLMLISRTSLGDFDYGPLISELFREGTARLIIGFVMRLWSSKGLLSS